MKSNLPESDLVAALRHLTLGQVEERLTELEGERASLSLLRRSLVARLRAEQRQDRRLSHDHLDFTDRLARGGGLLSKRRDSPDRNAQAHV